MCEIVSTPYTCPSQLPRTVDPYGAGTLTQEGGSTRFSGLLSQEGGIVLQGGGAMTMDALQAKANVTTQSDTILTLDNGSMGMLKTAPVVVCMQPGLIMTATMWMGLSSSTASVMSSIPRLKKEKYVIFLFM